MSWWGWVHEIMAEAKQEMPKTKLPPPPMPTVAKPKSSDQTKYEGYTADMLRAMQTPQEDLIFELVMEECKKVAVEKGWSSYRTKEHGFYQEKLSGLQQRVFDRLVAKGLDCKMTKTMSSQGTRWHLLVRW